MNEWVAEYLILRPSYSLLGEPVAALLPRFEETQWFSRGELLAYQSARLRAQLCHAYNTVPYYRSLMHEHNMPAGVHDNLETLRHFPILTRDHIRKHYSSLMSWYNPFRTQTRKTSGSSGQPLLLQKDRIATGVMNAVIWRNYRWIGIDMGDRCARVWAGPLHFLEKWKLSIRDTLLNRIRLSTFTMNPHAFDRFLKSMLTFRPIYLYGYGQSLYRLAAHALASNLELTSLNLRAVITTAEMIFDGQKQAMEEAFRAPVISEYGSTEVGTIAMECPKGKMHIMSDTLVVEVMKDGSPAAPGEEGDILITELYSSRMPLIRYYIGDRGILSDEQCACGRGLPVLQRLKGRVTDYIVCPDGTIVDPYFADSFLTSRPEFYAIVRQWRIHQPDRSHAILTLCTPDASACPELESLLRKTFNELCRQQVALEFSYEDWLRPAESGKTRLFSR